MIEETKTTGTTLPYANLSQTLTDLLNDVDALTIPDDMKKAGNKLSLLCFVLGFLGISFGFYKILENDNSAGRTIGFSVSLLAGGILYGIACYSQQLLNPEILKKRQDWIAQLKQHQEDIELPERDTGCFSTYQEPTLAENLYDGIRDLINQLEETQLPARFMLSVYKLGCMINTKNIPLGPTLLPPPTDAIEIKVVASNSEEQIARADDEENDITIALIDNEAEKELLLGESKKYRQYGSSG